MVVIKIILKNETQIVLSDLKQEKHMYNVLSAMVESYKLNNKDIELNLAGKDFNIKNVKEIIREVISNAISNIHHNK